VRFSAPLAVHASGAFAAVPPVTTSAKSGVWSAKETWTGNAIPGAGVRVFTIAGHTVAYDVKSDAVVRRIGDTALGMYPALAACSGLGLFTPGSTNWSRFFPLGLAAILACWPELAPLLYGAASPRSCGSGRTPRRSGSGTNKLLPHHFFSLARRRPTQCSRGVCPQSF
jgi:hypothetical protein